MDNSNRENDEKVSNELNELIIKLFYSKQVNSFEIVKDKERQVKGIDVIIGYNGKQIRLDEKGGTDHRNLSTFILELSTLDKNLKEVVPGWFLKEDSETDAYLLIWIDEDEKRPWNDGIELALVEKEKIIEYLNKFNLTHDELSRKATEIRNYINENGGWFSNRISQNEDNFLCVDEIPKFYMGKWWEDGYQFTRTLNKKERSICIRLPRKKYKEMALFTQKYSSKKYPEVAEFIKTHPAIKHK